MHFEIIFSLKNQLNASLNKHKHKELINSFENQIYSSSLLNHPKYAQYFKKRVCVKYVPDPKLEIRN